LEEGGYTANLSWLYEDITLNTWVERLKQGKFSMKNLDESTLFKQLNEHLKQSFQPMPRGLKCSFITGVTGFLGAYLLRSLLQQSDDQLVCLVRADSIEQGKQRVLQSLQQLSDYQTNWCTRIEVVIGSLGQAQFGLSDDTFYRLAQSLNKVIHNAANVNFVAPYHALREVNVLSNMDIIHLATAHHLKPIHYISTVAVFNSHERDQFALIEEDHVLEHPENLFSGYAQTKWMGEALYKKARERGLNVTFYRPGLIMGDSDNGYCHTDDFLCRFLKGCLQMQAFPDLAVEVDMTPVNYTADAISYLILSKDTQQVAYHFVNPRPYHLGQLCQWFKDQGYTVQSIPEQQWHNDLKHLDKQNAMYPVVPFLLEKSATTQETILQFFAQRGLNIAYQKTLDDLAENISCPPVDDVLLSCYLDYFVETGFLAKPLKKSS
jgi:thioester reductase-like protein